MLRFAALQPFLTAYATCRNRRGWASSCEHGTSHVKSICAIEQSTSWPSVAYTALPSVCKRVNWCDKKLNSSVLLSSTRRKSFQFFGIAAEGTTLLRTHLPLFCLVVPLRLSVFSKQCQHEWYFRAVLIHRAKHLLYLVQEGLSCSRIQHLNHSSTVQKCCINQRGCFWFCSLYFQTRHYICL